MKLNTDQTVAVSKTCTVCKKQKNLTDFYNDKSRKGGLSHRCKPCNNKRVDDFVARKKEALMSELVHTKQLADDFGIAEGLAASYLAAAKLSAHRLLVGKDTLSLFDKVTATKAIGDRVREEKELHAAHLARLEAAKVPTIKDVMGLLKAMSLDVSDVAELSEGVKKLADQNAIMFKVLTDMKANVKTEFSDLRAVVTGQQATPILPAIQIREPLPSVAQLKIGIVGLHSGDHAALKKELGDLFKLSILTPDEARKITGLKNMDKTYLMSKYVSHRHMDLLKAIGQTPVIIPGTVNDLKEALTALYLG